MPGAERPLGASHATEGKVCIAPGGRWAKVTPWRVGFGTKARGLLAGTNMIIYIYIYIIIFV